MNIINIHSAIVWIWFYGIFDAKPFINLDIHQSLALMFNSTLVEIDFFIFVWVYLNYLFKRLYWFFAGLFDFIKVLDYCFLRMCFLDFFFYLELTFIIHLDFLLTALNIARSLDHQIDIIPVNNGNERGLSFYRIELSPDIFHVEHGFFQSNCEGKNGALLPFRLASNISSKLLRDHPGNMEAQTNAFGV